MVGEDRLPGDPVPEAQPAGGSPGPQPDAPPVLEAVGVGKRFGAVVALDAVDLRLRPGQVHALVGENGAGKSTLALMLAGALRPDSGQILLDGAGGVLPNRGAAIAAGIGLVPQALSLIGELTLVENHLLSLAASGMRRRSRADARRQVAHAAALAEVELPIDRRTRDLAFAQRQLGEVVLALAQGARVLLLDEPTAAAGPVEADHLLGRVRALADAGTSVVLVTHRLDEVARVADEVTVLRAGHRVHHGRAGALGPHQLAELMVGERAADEAMPGARTGNERARQGGSALDTRARAPVRLRAQGLSAAANGGPGLHDVSLAVAGGEVLGVAGVAGSGQRVLAETLVGLCRPARGTVTVDGADVTGAPAAAVTRGVAYVPDDRADGVVETHSLADNAVVLRAGAPELTRAGLRLRRPAEAFARAVFARFGVHPPEPDLPAAALSGGNRQKLMVGRELASRLAVVVAHGPTQGLDVAAAAVLRRELRAAADAGAAVVLISTDLDEVLSLADRVMVLVGGRLVDEVPGADIDLARLGRAMAGLA
ncbi:MAG TPA: ATP-binding cassette domain-containing protein [Micromonosporaceae bacterium]|nr:ATP-binding cassette domain-containing protein [Micromonosporaceae bacterium]